MPSFISWTKFLGCLPLSRSILCIAFIDGFAGVFQIIQGLLHGEMVNVAFGLWTVIGCSMFGLLGLFRRNTIFFQCYAGAVTFQLICTIPWFILMIYGYQSRQQHRSSFHHPPYHHHLLAYIQNTLLGFILRTFWPPKQFAHLALLIHVILSGVFTLFSAYYCACVWSLYRILRIEEKAAEQVRLAAERAELEYYFGRGDNR
ncbi:hypothetical protein BJ085DRAFT_36082 [Dimargaris cristalligena]|uniref:Uncharacterized protein n=1 Tax=Dimargaris cristalligena TaxID=215637 RepID=A0A4P9ZWU9_9FUNG|nr:hypothetical protein BJ085DRAFT_36082 [Dimargaris cristalligena]|eukprot:RKP38103.1 hypothetical protein BJ085DRAFT_36082 [Dimargaris cristalligena]